ncbi:hypothetical protein HBI56_182460 [Parastagonospora nodorum]|uniref:Uncharacterized protein n=1 Tax=Phaeosphaeria nodorum (strain SN15 / ATCC MYA-4574 / FGSC 10173) TaxID=321614 RepID=A0A7U2I407_PHANO|nr:hypothetical protein HBH56_187870 [Parastagonospora nodorum]QRD00934.1 hypothetical protein JI435_415990 [Parastagonospora nodorum SN15]KAH3925279.1 hypothetical protein HBH54_180680 [Parastagonospora nodorum]KAH3953350.1 hypothetical protein HBH53_035330 [Parastagonospora nodorum]KAH3959135.1 hypothetical protein HBH52_246390 [Parastagonospora nodorum]
MFQEGHRTREAIPSLTLRLVVRLTWNASVFRPTCKHAECKVKCHIKQRDLHWQRQVDFPLHSQWSGSATKTVSSACQTCALLSMDELSSPLMMVWHTSRLC